DPCRAAAPPGDDQPRTAQSGADGPARRPEIADVSPAGPGWETPRPAGRPGQPAGDGHSKPRRKAHVRAGTPGRRSVARPARLGPPNRFRVHPDDPGEAGRRFSSAALPLRPRQQEDKGGEGERQGQTKGPEVARAEEIDREKERTTPAALRGLAAHAAGAEEG